MLLYRCSCPERDKDPEGGNNNVPGDTLKFPTSILVLDDASLKLKIRTNDGQFEGIKSTLLRKVMVTVFRQPGYGTDCPIVFVIILAAKIFNGCASPICASYCGNSVFPSLLICDHCPIESDEVIDIAGGSWGWAWLVSKKLKILIVPADIPNEVPTCRRLDTGSNNSPVFLFQGSGVAKIALLCWFAPKVVPMVWLPVSPRIVREGTQKFPCQIRGMFVESVTWMVLSSHGKGVLCPTMIWTKLNWRICNGLESPSWGAQEEPTPKGETLDTNESLPFICGWNALWLFAAQSEEGIPLDITAARLGDFWADPEESSMLRAILTAAELRAELGLMTQKMNLQSIVKGAPPPGPPREGWLELKLPVDVLEDARVRIRTPVSWIQFPIPFANNTPVPRSYTGKVPTEDEFVFVPLRPDMVRTGLQEP
jgi:hypothetical protein